MMHVMYSGLLGTSGHTDMTSWMHTYSVYVVNIIWLLYIVYERDLYRFGKWLSP